jgi:RecA-family ATPase
MNMLQGFSARNQIEDGQQQVVALIDGNEAKVAQFKKIVETTKLANAEVSRISCSDYEGNVMDNRGLRSDLYGSPTPQGHTYTVQYPRT